MDSLSLKPDLKALLRSSIFLFRIASIVCVILANLFAQIFSMIILACIDRDGYFLGHCVFYSGGSACGFALTVASLGFIFCFVYIIVDTLFLGIPQPYRKYIVMFDLGFDCMSSFLFTFSAYFRLFQAIYVLFVGFWTFIFFVLFCNMANHWQFSDAKPEVLNQINTNNVRAAIAFVFFSVISWVSYGLTRWPCVIYCTVLRVNPRLLDNLFS